MNKLKHLLLMIVVLIGFSSCSYYKEYKGKSTKDGTIRQIRAIVPTGSTSAYEKGDTVLVGPSSVINHYIGTDVNEYVIIKQLN